MNKKIKQVIVIVLLVVAGSAGASEKKRNETKEQWQLSSAERREQTRKDVRDRALREEHERAQRTYERIGFELPERSSQPLQTR
jgi:sortase (surface protein transpeptidase)